jgi:hypothetical protein
MPKLAEAMTSSDPPPDGISEYYNRSVFNKEILPLLKELRKALGQSASLLPEEKITLSRLVLADVRGYSRRYCAALTAFHLKAPIPSGSQAEVRTALLGLLLPGSAFIEHLRAVAGWALGPVSEAAGGVSGAVPSARAARAAEQGGRVPRPRAV